MCNCFLNTYRFFPLCSLVSCNFCFDFCCFICVVFGLCNLWCVFWFCFFHSLFTIYRISKHLFSRSISAGAFDVVPCGDWKINIAGDRPDRLIPKSWENAATSLSPVVYQKGGNKTHTRIVSTIDRCYSLWLFTQLHDFDRKLFVMWCFIFPP